MNDIEKIKFMNKEFIAERKLMCRKIDELKKDNLYFKEENERLNKELDAIIYSRSYKIIKKINKLIGRKGNEE